MVDVDARSASCRGFRTREAAAPELTQYLYSISMRWPHPTSPPACPCHCYLQPTIASTGSERLGGHFGVKEGMESGAQLNEPLFYFQKQMWPPFSRHACPLCCCGAALNPPRTLCSHCHPHPIFGRPVNSVGPPSTHHTQQQDQQQTHPTRRPRRRPRRRRPPPTADAPLPCPLSGLPYVICHHCSLLLLLPHKLSIDATSPLLTLKCGSCSKLLSFSTHHLFADSPTPALTPLATPPQSGRDTTEFPSAEPVEAPSTEPVKAPSTDPVEALSMPGKGASCEALAADRNLITWQPNISLSVNGNDEYVKGTQVFEQCIGVCGDNMESEADELVTVANDVSLDIHGFREAAQTSLDGDGCRMIQGKDLDIGQSCDSLHEQAATQDIVLQAKQCIDAESLHLHVCQDVQSAGNGVYTVADAHGEVPKGLPSDDSWDKEITAMNSVQNWVDSLSLDIGYESDPPLICTEKCAIGCEKHVAPHHRSPLHHHFGYKSPSELFEKIVFSEDDEMKARTESNSTASSSSSLANNVRLRTDNGAIPLQVHTQSLQRWHTNGPNNKQDAQSMQTSSLNNKPDVESTLMRFLRKGSKQGGNAKTKSIIVNGHVLSSSEVKQAEERAGKLRPGSYWYDCKAGFWGVEGGPCLGVLPPFIEELSLHPMTGNCSNGDTQVYVNGRELHSKDLTILARRGLSGEAGKAYALDFDGVLVDETTCVEIKRLGKLAPTVERKGKGFGMFAANAVQEQMVVAQRELVSPSH